MHGDVKLFSHSVIYEHSAVELKHLIKHETDNWIYDSIPQKNINAQYKAILYICFTSKINKNIYPIKCLAVMKTKRSVFVDLIQARLRITIKTNSYRKTITINAYLFWR